MQDSQEIKRGDVVTVRGYNGIAWDVLGQSTETIYDEYGDSEEIESEGWLDVVMVGDDRIFSLECSIMGLISDKNYCQGCGQIGCTQGYQF